MKKLMSLALEAALVIGAATFGLVVAFGLPLDDTKSTSTDKPKKPRNTTKTNKTIIPPNGQVNGVSAPLDNSGNKNPATSGNLKTLETVNGNPNLNKNGKVVKTGASSSSVKNTVGGKVNAETTNTYKKPKKTGTRTATKTNARK